MGVEDYKNSVDDEAKNKVKLFPTIEDVAKVCEIYVDLVNRVTYLVSNHLRTHKVDISSVRLALAHDVYENVFKVLGKPVEDVRNRYLRHNGILVESVESHTYKSDLPPQEEEAIEIEVRAEDLSELTRIMGPDDRLIIGRVHYKCAQT